MFAGHRVQSVYFVKPVLCYCCKCFVLLSFFQSQYAKGTVISFRQQKPVVHKSIRVPTGQGKLEKVREFEWSGKIFFWKNQRK